MTELSSRPIKLHRAWIVAAITFVTLIAAAAFRSTTSIMFEPLEDEFGWTRSLTSNAVAVNLVIYGLTAPFAATLMERFTVRRVAVSALALVSLGTGLTVFMTQGWQLILYWGVFVGLGTGCLALVFGSLVANRWFTKRRGLVTGIFSAAYATGQLIFLPMLSNVVL
jgi:MFS family permease